MAKAMFHKAQRVFVKPVGTWAVVEKVEPQWVKDVEEPLRVTYDCGLGRSFTASELVSEAAMRRSENPDGETEAIENWRLMRQRNRWQDTDECAAHPFPGTYPVIITDEQDWGGWRVPMSEYDRDPMRIEHQARLVCNAPGLLRIVRALVEAAGSSPETVSSDLMEQARKGRALLRHVYDIPDKAALARTNSGAAQKKSAAA